MKALLCALQVFLVSCPAPDTPEPKTQTKIDRPALPRLTDWVCPSNWRSVSPMGDTSALWPTDLAEYTVCQPPPQVQCPDGQAQFLGEDHCEVIGTECPVEDFHTEQEIRALAPGYDGQIWYVLAGASGNGSRGDPFGSFTASLVAQNGDIVAIGKGEFDDVITIPTGVAYVGSCVDRTVIRGPGPSDSLSIVEFTGSTGTGLVSNLRLDGSRIGIYVASFGMSARISRVEIIEPVGGGVYAAEGAASLEVEELVVRRVQRAVRNYGWGILAGSLYQPIQVDIRRVVVEDGVATGLYFAGADAVARVEDVVVRNTRPLASNDFGGYGILVSEGATVELQRVLLDNNTSIGFSIEKLGTSVTADDVVVSNTRQNQLDLASGSGCAIYGGASLVGKRLLLTLNHSAGLMAKPAEEDPPGLINDIKITDMVIRDTQVSTIDNGGGMGFFADDDVAADIRRAWFAGNHRAAFACGGALSQCQLKDAVLFDTKEEQLQHIGMGLAVHSGAGLLANRVLIEDSVTGALSVHHADSQADLEDITIRRVFSRESDGRGGTGIQSSLGAALTLTRCHITQARGAGLYLDSADHNSLSHITVEDTLPTICVEYTADDPRYCVDDGVERGGGSALVAIRSQFSLDQFDFSQNYQAGFLLGVDVQLQAANGLVHHNAIGASVHDDNFDLDAFDKTVSFYDNGLRLDSRLIPLPDIIEIDP